MDILFEGRHTMKLLSMQIALFTGGLIGRPDLVMSEINAKLGSVFDTMPNILNLPPEIPAEIPLVQTKSSDGIYSLNVSRNRIDLIVSPQYEKANTPLEMFKEYKYSIDKYCKAALNITDLVRIGIIITLFQESEENTRAVYEKYLNIPFSSDCVEINFRTNHQSISKGIVYNNIKTVEAGELHVENMVYKGVIIQLDTNNVPENGVTISTEMINSLLVQVSGKIKPSALKELI